MPIKIKTITLPLFLRMGEVNCYLVDTGEGYILIDTGGPNNRKELVRELERFGCKPGTLNLIVLTHGDFDHTGNAAYLRSAFGAKIAMHADDAGMAERGDMFVNRRRMNALIRRLIPLFAGFGRAERFTPDIRLDDGDDLNEYGLDARVISIPGHSKGSIAILTGDGELFCGDLFENRKGPALSSIMDKIEVAKESLQKLREMRIDMVYPGHGEPFKMHEVKKASA